MLEQIMDFIHNYFVKERYTGTFEIVDSRLSIDFLQNNQYYKIIGSVFNDGVHQYPSEDLTDEVFAGQVWAMAVPPTLIALCAEIEEWQNKYGDAVMSPYSSESFGGYSYTKASGTGARGEALPGATWQSVFGNRLNHWRKLA